jgi:hypothetical protein
MIFPLQLSEVVTHNLRKQLLLHLKCPQARIVTPLYARNSKMKQHIYD